MPNKTKKVYEKSFRDIGRGSLLVLFSCEVVSLEKNVYNNNKRQKKCDK